MAEPSRQEIEAAKAKFRAQGLGVSAEPPAPRPISGTAEPTRGEIEAAKVKFRGKTSAEIIQMVQPGLRPRIEPEPEKSLGRQALEGVAAVGEFIDKYTGAPTRSAINRVINDSRRDESMVPGPEGLPKPLKMAGRTLQAFAEQFGEDPGLAPTGKEIAANLGASTEEVISLPLIGGLSPAGAAGLIVDIAADPTNLIPGRLATRVVTTGAAKGAGKVAATAGKAIAKTDVAARAAERGKDVAESFARLVKPKIADDFEQLTNFAKRHNIQTDLLPESFEFGKGSFIDKASRQRNEALLGEKYIERFEQGLNEARRATDDVINTIAKGSGADRIEAGNAIRSAYEKAAAAFSGEEFMFFNKVADDYPGLKLHPKAEANLNAALNGMEKWAKGQIQRAPMGEQRAQAAQLLKDIAAIRKNRTFKQVSDASQRIKAFETKNWMARVPADEEAMRKIYGDMREALAYTVKNDVKDGDKILDQINVSNKSYAAFKEATEPLARILGNPNVAPEQVFDQLITNGTSDRIGAVRGLFNLAGDDFGVIKGAMLRELRNKSGGDLFSFNNFKKTIARKEPQLKFVLDGADAAALSEAVRFGDRFGELTLNTSRTAISQLFRDIGNNLLTAIHNEAILEQLKGWARAKNSPATNRINLIPEGVPAGSQMRLGPDTGNLLPSGIRTYSVQRQNEKDNR